MHYIERIQLGIDYIEECLEQDIDIANVARAANMSRWHFQRMFKAITGDTVKSYIRTRRFSLALENLLASDRAIIDIAMDAGFDTQESFTRAFKQHFAMTPGQFRELGEARKFMQRIRMDKQYLQHINSGLSREPEIQLLDAALYVGLKTTFYGVDSEKNNFADKLSVLWDTFLPRMDEINNAIPDIGYGLVEQTAEDSELLNYYSVMKVGAIASIPDDMVYRSMTAGHYAVFAHCGDPLLLDNTVNYIYGTWLPHSDYEHKGSADIEIYDHEYIPDSDESIVYYAIPLNDK